MCPEGEVSLQNTNENANTQTNTTLNATVNQDTNANANTNVNANARSLQLWYLTFMCSEGKVSLQKHNLQGTIFWVN